MVYSSDYTIHIAKTPTRKTFVSKLEAKFSFKEEIKLESEADPNFKNSIKERIGTYENNLNNLVWYLCAKEGFRHDGFDRLISQKRNARIKIYLFRKGFELSIEANGILPREEMIDLEKLNRFVLYGDQNSNYDSDDNEEVDDPSVIVEVPDEWQLTPKDEDGVSND